MGLFGDLFSERFDEVAKHITNWRPADCSTEKDYENSLYQLLHKKLPDSQVTKKYTKGKNSC